MRRLLTYLLIAACVIKVVPAEYPAHRRAEGVVDEVTATLWQFGARAAQSARETLRERRSREKTKKDERERQQQGGSPVAGRAALGDRLTARVDERADRIAQAAPASVERSVDALAAYLERRAGPTMRGRTRAAFRWVADHIAYDLSLTRAERMARNTQSPGTVLQSREAVCEGYVRLFVALAERMGLEATFIGGTADPAGPGGGDSHAWASVKLADGWYLLDPTWAAGGVRRGRFVSQFDEEWWLVSPERMYRTHQPDERRWALGAAGAAQPGLLGRLFE
jgi:transglutaminase-like putative cysteine protease